jgi:ureidoglycolate hydrolase
MEPNRDNVMTTKRYLMVNLTGGMSIKISQSDLEKMYGEFKLPFPSINKAVLSCEFRKAVNEHGITLTNVDRDDLGLQTFIPPHRIHSMVLVVANVEMRDFDIFEELRSSMYADL